MPTVKREPSQLRQHADIFLKLAAMPERVTKDDLMNAADLLRDAAADLERICRGSLPGCVCQEISESDTHYGYLVYSDKCTHHKHLKAQLEKNKHAYEEAEVKLKKELRPQFVAAALQGLLAYPDGGENAGDPVLVATNAVALADATIEAMLK